jgi:hypothetical protein
MDLAQERLRNDAEISLGENTKNDSTSNLGNANLK